MQRKRVVPLTTEKPKPSYGVAFLSRGRIAEVDLSCASIFLPL